MALSNYEKHKRYIAKKRANAPTIPCGCGCGTMICGITKSGAPATYAHGHNPDGEATQYKLGHTETAEMKEKRFAGKRARPDGFKPSPSALENVRAAAKRRKESGWRPSPEQLERIRANVKRGPDNPMFGRKHTPETREVSLDGGLRIR